MTIDSFWPCKSVCKFLLSEELFMRFSRPVSIVAAIFATLCFVSAHADTLASFTVDTASIGDPNYLGESFFAGGFGTFDNIAFNFFSPTGADYAIGTGYLFSTPYTGTPTGLNSSDPGFLGSAVAAGGVYTFSPTVKLNSGTLYYFYENVLAPSGAVAGAVPGPGDAKYLYSTGPSVDFAAESVASADFLVAGWPVSAVTPEPAGVVLLGTGMLGIASVIRRRFAKGDSRPGQRL
jgi:hypothetical protein